MPLLNINNEVAMSLSKLHNQVEARIARFLVNDLLSRGLIVSIFHEEGLEVERSQNKNEICLGMAATDIDWVRVHDPVLSKTVGVFMLVYGNGEDLLSDHSDNRLCNEIADKVYDKFY
jgi:hypothetical protein